MGAPYSLALWKRVVGAIKGGMFRNQAAKQFGVAISTAINWARSITVRYGSSSMPRSSASKKSLVAGERDRPDVARRRGQWTKYQDRVDGRASRLHRRVLDHTDMAP
jgi:transposase